MAWAATDGSGNLAYKYDEQPEGSALRLSLLKIHISEVRQAISQGNYSTEGKSHDYSRLVDYLTRLEADRDKEAAASSVSSGRRTSFTRGITRSD